MRLLRDRSGASAVFIAVMLIPLMVALGIAVDGLRLYMIQSRLTTATDAAALIAARDLSQTGYATNAANLFWANFQRSSASSTQGFLGANITSVAVTSPAANVSNITVQGTVPTTLMNLVGIANMPIQATSQSTAQTTGVEITLALDNTGSMAGWPIQAVISSAGTLINDLYGNSTADTLKNLYMAVVPFVAAVNIGNSHTSWLKAGSYNAASYSPTTWSGCVMARYDTTDSATGLTNDFTDVPPGQAPFTPFLWASTYGKYSVTSKGKTVSITGDNDWTSTNVTETQNASLGNNAVGPNLSCPISSTGTPLPILPETQSRTAVLAEINSMIANSRGGTFINLGLQAAWWTLSPRWQGSAGWGNATLPLAYNTPNMKKVIVLMTDGNNLWYDWSGGAPGAGPSPWVNDGNTDFSAYGRLLDNNMGLSTNQNTVANSTTNINNKMLQLCTLIKNQGIIIYTVLFNHDGTITSDTQTLFQNCATTPSDYFLDATAAQLQATFSAIGAQINNLYISQ